MLAQRFRHRVDLQRKVPATLPSGEPAGFTWQPFRAGVPASLVPLSGRELMAAAAEQAEVRIRCTMRWIAGVEPAMRLVHDGVAHNIIDVIPDPTYRRHLTLMLSQGLKDG